MSTIANIVLNAYNGTSGPDTLQQNIKDFENEERLAAAALQTKKEQLQHAFVKGQWTVKFIKVDGTNSEMICTLDPLLLPATDDGKTTRKQSSDLIHVFSTDRNGWRSFKIENLIGISPYSQKL